MASIGNRISKKSPKKNRKRKVDLRRMEEEIQSNALDTHEMALVGSYAGLDEIRRLLSYPIKRAAQMGANLHRHDTGVHDPHILCSIKLQPPIDYAAQVLPHHRTRSDRMVDRIERVQNPVFPGGI
jgi:hypothetical protein